MIEKPRILPIAIAAAIALLALKAVMLWSDWGAFFEPVSPAQAATKQVAPEESAPGEGDPPAHEEVPVEDEPPSAAVPAEQSQYTRAEIDVLEKLSERREALDARARELDLKEKLLAASERRVDERIAELKAIEARIQSTLTQRDEAQQAQIASLVKVYESMKPKDAARIFEELDMEILLPVARLMKAPKIAAVLAQMEPEKAKRLTVGLAKQLEMPEQAAATKS